MSRKIPSTNTTPEDVKIPTTEAWFGSYGIVAATAICYADRLFAADQKRDGAELLAREVTREFADGNVVNLAAALQIADHYADLFTRGGEGRFAAAYTVHFGDSDDAILAAENSEDENSTYTATVSAYLTAWTHGDHDGRAMLLATSDLVTVQDTVKALYLLAHTSER